MTGVIIYKSKAEEIAAQILSNADGLKFGSVTVTLKFFGGHLVTISYAKTEQTMEQVKNDKSDSEV
jgi:hypothetical protein